MCVVSMVMQTRTDDWLRRYWDMPYPQPVQPIPVPISPLPQPAPTQQEIDEFRRLLERARQYDREHNEPDCEMEDKRRLLKDMAEKLGVKIEFV